VEIISHDIDLSNGSEVNTGNDYGLRAFTYPVSALQERRKVEVLQIPIGRWCSETQFVAARFESCLELLHEDRVVSFVRRRTTPFKCHATYVR
jgi:hypothetical protein